MPAIKLKPCPFCGQEPRQRVEVCKKFEPIGNHSVEYLCFTISCYWCNVHKSKEIRMSSIDMTFEKVIAAIETTVEMWNTRAELSNQTVEMK